MGTEQQIRKLLKTELEVRNLFYNQNYSRFGIIEKLEAKRIYEQGGNKMQLITLTEIANLHNAVLFPYQVEELSCNKHIVEVDCIGKAYNNCVSFLFTLVNGQRIKVFEKLMIKTGGVKI